MRASIGVLAMLFWSLCLGREANSQGTKVTYDEHVLPVFKDKCITCHNPDKGSGGLSLNTYTGLMTGGASGEVIRPGDADNSRLFQLVSHRQQPHMPPKSPRLAAENLELLRQWIAGGALENAGSKPRQVDKPKTDVALAAVARGRPPGPPPMPPAGLAQEPIVQTARPNAITALTASPWAPLVAVGGQKQVLLYNTDTLDLLGVLPFPEGVPHILRFSRNGSLLLAGGGRGGHSGKVVVWSVTSGERIISLGDEADLVLAADISADQTQIALGGPGKVVRVYSTTDGKMLHEIKKHTDWIMAVEYSPDGVLLATADRGGALFVWESYTGREYLAIRGHTATVTELSWRADSNVLASACEDSNIRLWEMENGGQVKAWAGHPGGVQSVKFGHDGRIISAGRDRVVKIWDSNGAQQKAFEALPDIALRTAFTHDAARAIAGDWSGQVRVWTISDGKAAGTFSANPASVAVRLEAATKDLAARKAAHEQLVATAATSDAAAKKTTTELAAVQQTAALIAATAKTASERAGFLKENLLKTNQAETAAKADATAREVASAAYAEAAAKIKQAAEKAKDNKRLAEESAKSQVLATQSAAELAAARKTVTDLGNTTIATQAQLTAAEQEAAEAAAAAPALNRSIQTWTAQAKAAAEKAAADKDLEGRGAAAVASTQTTVDRLRVSAQAVLPKTANK